MNLFLCSMLLLTLYVNMCIYRAGVEKVAKASSDLRSSIRELERGGKAGEMLLNNKEVNKELENQEFWYKRGSKKAKLRQRGRKYDQLFHGGQRIKKVPNINISKVGNEYSPCYDSDGSGDEIDVDNDIGNLSDPD